MEYITKYMWHNTYATPRKMCDITHVIHHKIYVTQHIRDTQKDVRHNTSRNTCYITPVLMSHFVSHHKRRGCATVCREGRKLCCSVLQCVAVCCSVLQCAAVYIYIYICIYTNNMLYASCRWKKIWHNPKSTESVFGMLLFFSLVAWITWEFFFHSIRIPRNLICLWCECVAVCCSVLQCVAVCCSVLQCAAVLQCFYVMECVGVESGSWVEFVAACCSALQCFAVHQNSTRSIFGVTDIFAPVFFFPPPKWYLWLDTTRALTSQTDRM